jgi:hypothetical protein
MKSVLQNWVMELPLREQGTLLTAVRGCDLAPKLPLDSFARQLTGWLRWTFLNPADIREVGIKGAFFQSEIPSGKQSELGHYPFHWVSHIMHALEVVAYRHPDNRTRYAALNLYSSFCHSFHLYPETREQMINRLSEDRIASGKLYHDHSPIPHHGRDRGT